MDRTCWKPKFSSIIRARPRSKTLSTTGTSFHRVPRDSRMANPVSMFVRSALVSTATAEASERLTAACVWRCVASTITTGNAQSTGAPEVAICVVVLHDDDRSPSREEAFDDLDADRAQAYYDDVTDHTGYSTAPERLLDAPAYQDVCKQGEADRNQGSS